MSNKTIMAMRSIWSGSLSFGLVNIPVKLYSASESGGLDFKMFDKKDMCPVGYKRICKNDDHEVPYEDIVKGYEYRKGEFVVLEDEDFEKVSPKRTKTIDVKSFVQDEDIEDKYFEKPYFVEPEENAKKAYSLLVKALNRSDKVAIVKYILRTKEHLGAVKPEGDILMLHQMRFQAELRSPDKLELPSEEEEVADQEVEMALNLIEQLSDNFRPEKYEDTYTEDLKSLIEQKAKGKEIERPKEEVGAPTTEMDEIMEALRKSLQEVE